MSIKYTLCLLKCNKEYRELTGKNSLKRMSEKNEFQLISAEHYGYLHNCYYKVNNNSIINQNNIKTFMIYKNTIYKFRMKIFNCKNKRKQFKF